MPEAEAHVGHFMVAAGALIRLAKTDKILVVKRDPRGQNFQPSEWEIIYGRIDQGESLEEGLRREVEEESGITDLEVGPMLRHWHIYRGEKVAAKEVIGITFICQVKNDQVVLSREHSEYAWVTPDEAIKLIKVEGIKQDIITYQKLKDQKCL